MTTVLVTVWSDVTNRPSCDDATYLHQREINPLSQINYLQRTLTGVYVDQNLVSAVIVFTSPEQRKQWRYTRTDDVTYDSELFPLRNSRSTSEKLIKTQTSVLLIVHTCCPFRTQTNYFNTFVARNITCRTAWDAQGCCGYSHELFEYVIDKIRTIVTRYRLWDTMNCKNPAMWYNGRDI